MAFMKHQVLLSICIPTYNRADKLKICLECIDDAIKNIDKNQNIEVVISDNNSDDETSSIIENYKAKIKNLKSYRNRDNLGFNQNMLLLLNQYSNGEYIWMIGDDDYIDSNAISKIMNIIYNYKPNIILVKHRIFQKLEDFFSFRKQNNILFKKKNDGNILILPFLKAIDYIAVPSNIFCTFMSSAIFKKESIKKEYVVKIKDNKWDAIYNIFPNAYIIINSLYREKRTFIINDCIISVVASKKSWDDKMDSLWLRHIPDLYHYIMSMNRGKYKLKNSKILIIKNNIAYFKRASIVEKIKNIHTITKNVISCI